MGTKTLTLSDPVKYMKKDLHEITFRRGKGSDLVTSDAEEGKIAKGMRMAAQLSNLPMRIFDDMCGDDLLMCLEAAQEMSGIDSDDDYDVVENSDGTKTLQLPQPVEYLDDEKADAVIETLTFRKAKGKDWRKTDIVDAPLERQLVMASLLSGVPKKVFLGMCGKDVVACFKVVDTMGKK